MNTTLDNQYIIIITLGNKFIDYGGKELAEQFINNNNYDIKMFKETLFDMLDIDKQRIQYIKKEQEQLDISMKKTDKQLNKLKI